MWHAFTQLPCKHTWCIGCSGHQTTGQTLSSFPCRYTGGRPQTTTTPMKPRTSWPAESRKSCRDHCRTGGSNRPVVGAEDYHKLMADTPVSSNRTPRTGKGKCKSRGFVTTTLSTPPGRWRPYQAFASLASVDPLLAALELYVFEFLVRTHLLRTTLRTAGVSQGPFASCLQGGAVAGLFPARDDALITAAFCTRVTGWRNLLSVRNLHVLEHAA